MKNMKKILTMMGVIALTAAIAIGGTFAYLTKQATVTNTFTVGNVTITMDEAKVKTDGTYATDVNNRGVTNDYHLLPGHYYIKDPTVHVADKSENCYLFVKVTNNLSDVIASDSTKGIQNIDEQMKSKNWEPLTGIAEEGVYYYYGDNADKAIKSVAENTNVQVFGYFQLKDDAVVEGLETERDTDGKPINNIIAVTAYAIQVDGFENASIADIWNAAKVG